MAGENDGYGNAERVALAKEIATLGEIRVMIELEAWDSLDDEWKDRYCDALQGVIDRNAKILGAAA